MTAEPLRAPSDDPTEILRVLPTSWHEQFLAEYHSALDTAHDVWRYQQLREVLHLWRARAVAYSNPTFEAAARAAQEGREDEFVSADHVLPGWSGHRS